MNLEQLHAHKAHLKKIHNDTMSAINIQIAAAIKKRKATCAMCNFKGTLEDWIFVQTFRNSPGEGVLCDTWEKLPPTACIVICPACDAHVKVADHLFHTEFIETIEEEDVSPDMVFWKVFEKYGDQPIETPIPDSD